MRTFEPEYVHPRIRAEADFLEACRLGVLSPREILKRHGKLPPAAGGSLPGGGWLITWTAVALSAATAKTIAGVATGSGAPVQLPELSVSGDATSGNILIELVVGTNASNPPGTNSSSFTPLQVRGNRSQALGLTAATNWTSEPTVLTVVKRWRMPWPAGPFVLQAPLGRELDSITTSSTAGKFVGLRLTSSVTANVDGYLEVEE